MLSIQILVMDSWKSVGARRAPLGPAFRLLSLRPRPAPSFCFVLWSALVLKSPEWGQRHCCTSDLKTILRDHPVGGCWWELHFRASWGLQVWCSGPIHTNTSTQGGRGVSISLKEPLVQPGWGALLQLSPAWTESGDCQSGSEPGEGSLGTCAQLHRRGGVSPDLCAAFAMFTDSLPL